MSAHGLLFKMAVPLPVSGGGGAAFLFSNGKKNVS